MAKMFLKKENETFWGTPDETIVATSDQYYVSPSVWKKAFGLSSSKQASLDLAKLKFGNDKIWDIKSNDGIAEAALISLFWIERFGR